MNVYDSYRIKTLMVSYGYMETQNHMEADVLIFYTCNVREKAKQKLLSSIGMLRTKNTKVIAVGGCVAQAEKDSLFGKRGINIVFGPQTYHNLPDYISDILQGKESRIIDVDLSQGIKFKHFKKLEKASISEFVPIQEGCDNFCSYCIVPYTRGREYSRPAADILEDIKHLVSLGTKEITLLGQNVNSYHGEAPYITIGASKETWRLERLIQEILEINGIKRLRYVSPHPKDFTEDLMKLHAASNILVPFAHIPAQSGNNRILKIMNRGHTREQYLEKLEKFRSICPCIQFSSDFIVGFPSETEEEFYDTVDLVEKAKYTISFSFKYSPRKGTLASTMDDQVPEQEKTKRLHTLQKALLKSQKEFNKSLVGKAMDVLFERPGKLENQYIGKNIYLQSVIVESKNNLIGTFKNVKVSAAYDNCVIGDIV